MLSNEALSKEQALFEEALRPFGEQSERDRTKMWWAWRERAVLAAAEADKASSEADATAWLKEARRLYSKWTDEQGIHCNRFPAWSELSLREHSDWIDKARAALSNKTEGSK
jgi:hypothetical protein